MTRIRYVARYKIPLLYKLIISGLFKDHETDWLDELPYGKI